MSYCVTFYVEFYIHIIERDLWKYIIHKVRAKKNVVQKSYFKYSLDGKIFIHDMQKKIEEKKMVKHS